MKRFSPILLLPMVVSLSSCIDKSYDLEDVDYTIGTYANLTLPSSSTGDIILRNVMNLEEDGVVQVIADPTGTHDSIFVIRQSGEADITPVSIGKISIKKPTINDFSTTADLIDLITGKSVKRKTKIHYEYTVSGKKETFDYDIPTQEYTYSIDESKAQTTITNTFATDISADVLDIDRVKCEDVTVTIKLTTKGIYDWIQYIHFDGLWIDVPQEIHIKKCIFDGEEIESVSKRKTERIQLTSEKDSKLRNTKSLTITLVFDRATTGKNFIYDATRHRIDMIGDLRLGGIIRFNTDDLNEDILNAKLATLEDQMIDFINSEDKDLAKLKGVIPTRFTISSHIEFDKDIAITNFTGRVRHKVGKVNPLELNDLPDFLNDEEVVLDLDNPMIYLTTYSELPADAYTTLILSSDTDEETHETEPLSVLGYGTTCNYYLADKEETRYHLPEFAKNTPNFIRVKNFGNLIKKIPQQIGVEITPVEVDCEDLDLSKEYNLQANYDIFMPLAFNPNFRLVYQKSDKGWDLDEDLGNLDAEQISATAKVTSNVPAKIDMTLIPLDQFGKEIKALKVNSIRIKENAKNEAVELIIKAADGYRIKDALAGTNGVSKLDGFTYRAVIKEPVNNNALSSDAKIKISDIKLTLQGLITYDAN